MKTLTRIGAVSALALALAACDNGPSAVADNQTQAAAPAARDAAPTAERRAATDHRQDPVPELDGKPMWAASQRYSAEESARRGFERNGEAFGARDVEAFVRKAHAFVEKPPAGTLRFVRANGDHLFYDPKDNVFAVTNAEGAPRTLFKPDDGMAYWQEQKDRDAQRRNAQADRPRSTRSDADAG